MSKERSDVAKRPSDRRVGRAAPWEPVFHTFKQRDPGGPPLGLGRMSARDRWRYAESQRRFRLRYGEPKPLSTGEIGTIDGFRIVTQSRPNQ
jgi:hypothetical protein